MSSQTSNYSRFDQIRVAIPAADAWVPIVIPPGAHDVIIALENMSTMRLSTVDTINPATEGLPFAGPSTHLHGTCANDSTIFVSAASGPTHAIAMFTRG